MIAPAPEPPKPRGHRLDHDQARSPRSRRPGQSGRHPGQLPGTSRRHRARAGGRRPHEPPPRPRAVDDRGRRHRRARTPVLRYRPARRLGRRHRRTHPPVELRCTAAPAPTCSALPDGRPYGPGRSRAPLPWKRPGRSPATTSEHHASGARPLRSRQMYRIALTRHVRHPSVDSIRASGRTYMIVLQRQVRGSNPLTGSQRSSRFSETYFHVWL